MELRNSTAGDRPIGFVDKVAAWEIYGDVGFEMFARFVGALDSTFLKKQNESPDKRKLEGSKRRKAEATAKKLKAESKQIGRK